FLMLAGCGSGNSDSAFAPPGSPTDLPTEPTSPPAPSSLTGVVMGGRQPIGNSTVRVWAASATPGGPATLLGRTQTGSKGKFEVAFDPVPAPGEIVYAVATGGDAGSGTNGAIRLATVVGAYCH